ncbi:MAG: hypothetical protein IPQ16_15105 [Geobacteraceae bacterium]|nr:hypothetical protein [Geobacteraceae bacterium]
MEQDGYQWWIDRFRTIFCRLFDIVRVDPFAVSKR